MDYYMSAFILFCLFSLSSASSWVTYRYAIQPRVGKPGPVGPQGPSGIVNNTATEEKIAAKYLDLESRIDKKIERFKRIVMGQLKRSNVEIEKTQNETEKRINVNRKDLESTIDGKIERFKRIVMGQLNRSNVEIEKSQNETEKRINVNQKDFEAKIDERFAKLEGIAEARLDRSDREIETIRNETTKKSKSIEENRKNLESKIYEKFLRFKRMVMGQLKRSTAEIKKTRNETEKGINENRKDLEHVINVKIERFKRIVNGQLERSNVEMEKIRNETEKRINENQKDLEAGIDERFEKLERILVARLERGDTKIGKIQNETTKNSKTIEIFLKRTPIWPSCDDIPRSDHESQDGKGGIFNIIRGGTLYELYCDMTTDGGGWTVFQRRLDGTVDFYRDWEDYAKGFGYKYGEFWLGLEAVYQLTQNGAYELRVDITDWDGNTAYAKYRTFSISGRSDNYRLTAGEYSGTADDSLAYHNNLPFSAKNNDLDTADGNCAITHQAAWWFNRCALSSHMAQANTHYFYYHQDAIFRTSGYSLLQTLDHHVQPVGHVVYIFVYDLQN